jgi:hypothetical protein
MLDVDNRISNSAAWQRLWVELVPATGKCATVEGEMMRAIARIEHDYYNNGFGNNWSGAYNYLDKHLGLRSGERKVLKKHARGKQARNATYDAYDVVAVTIENVTARVVNQLLSAEQGNGWEPNDVDMFSLQEPNG